MYSIKSVLPKALFVFFLILTACRFSPSPKGSQALPIAEAIDTTLNQYLQGVLSFRLADLSSRIDVSGASAIIIDHTQEHNQLIAFAQLGTDADDTLFQASYPCGSLLKPFIHTAVLADSMINPDALYANLPSTIDGYYVENADPNAPYEVSIATALVRSYNVPFVSLLSQWGAERFEDFLSELSFSYHPLPKNRLAMACEGVDASLLSLVQLYTYFPRKLREDRQDSAWHAAVKTVDDLSSQMPSNAYLSSQIYHGQFVYKSALSYGGQHAWAIGFDQKYVVGICIHDANPRPTYPLSGSRDGAPFLYTVFQKLSY